MHWCLKKGQASVISGPYYLGPKMKGMGLPDSY